MIILRLLALVVLAVCSPVLSAAAQSPGTDQLAIVTASGTHDFSVEVMRSRDELEKGLMFRRQMAADRGMLFDFGTPQDVSMWMKDTYLPLDMLFIGQDGRIVSLKQNAVPMSEDIISSRGPVIGVLEINAGTVKRIGVRVGDLVRHPMFRS